MKAEEKRASALTAHQLNEALKFDENIISTIREPLLVLNADLRILTANQSFYRMFSETPDQTIGKVIFEAGAGEWNIPKLRKLLDDILSKNTSFDDYEVDHDFPTLGRRTMLLNARRIHNGGPETHKILLAIEDITERKQLGYQIMTSELRYRRLFETAQDGILVLNADTGNITDVNPFLIDMLGYSKEEFIGKSLWELGFLSDIVANRRAFQELQEKGYIRYENLPLKTKAGQPLQVEFVSNFYTVNGDRVIQCNIRDITQRKKAEQLRDDFIGVISHELKNPLTVILGSLALVAEGKVSEKESIELVKEAFKQADEMTNLIDNLLEFARRQSDRLIMQSQPVDIKIITATVIAKLKGKSTIHRLINDIPPGLPPAMADMLRVERIIYNLMDNAIKYSTGGGDIRVSAILDEAFIKVSISDQGPGISEKDQTRLFENFERLDEAAIKSIQGTGMGLRVCGILVAAQGGKIWLKSEKGHGSTFFFTLPISK
jgi:PAS domain S-box-containing protein